MRNGVVITIKPLENREELAAELTEALAEYDRDCRLIARTAGRTSIDVTYEAYTKANMLELILQRR